MDIRKGIRRLASLFHRETGTPIGVHENAVASMLMEQDDEVSDLLAIPSDVHSRSAWDEYWSRTLKSEFAGMIIGFGDQMSSNPRLVKVLKERGVNTVLCVGNGMSLEATTLALHGFDVTALDISAVPGEFFDGIVKDTAHPFRQIPGTTVEMDKAVRFGVVDALDPALCPPIHHNPEWPPQGGGLLRHVTADLMDESACPGPYDCLIERRTVQLFPERERPLALDRLAARLQTPGLFVSHQHRGAWRPGEPLTHWAAALVGDRGFAHEPDSAPKLAHLIFTTG